MSSTSFDRTFYNPATGNGIYSTRDEIEPYPDWVDGIYDMVAYYFPDGVPTLRVEMTPTIVGNDPAVVDSQVSFSGFPDDAKVRIDGIHYQLDDGAINFTPMSSGVYGILAIHPAFLNWRGAINAS